MSQEEYKKEEQIHGNQLPPFGIEADFNDLNVDKEREKRIVPKPKVPKITDPSPAGE